MEQRYSEIERANIPEKFRHIDEVWKSKTEWVSSSRSTILNYLFVLNTGGLAGALTYMATKSPSGWISFSIYAFIIGAILITFHAAGCYYMAEISFSRWRASLQSFYRDQITWEELLRSHGKSPIHDAVFHILGWGSGLAAASDIIAAAFELK